MLVMMLMMMMMLRQLLRTPVASCGLLIGEYVFLFLTLTSLYLCLVTVTEEEVKREYYQNCSVLDCVTQCSQSAAHSCEQFLQVQQIGFVTLGPLRLA